jgi:hypothetical protein
MSDFIEKNNVVIFTLLGVILGGLLTFLSNWFIIKKKMKLKLKEKVLDKRVQAHENIINLTKTLRTMEFLGIDTELSEVQRIPYMFSSRQKFDEWYMIYIKLISDSTTWLSNDLIKEINLFQDYIVNLFDKIKNLDDNKLKIIGNVVKYDFIEFSGHLERIAYRLFEKDLYKLKLSDLKKWHKYEKSEIIKRLQNTELLKKEKEINRIINDSNNKND